MNDYFDLNIVACHHDDHKDKYHSHSITFKYRDSDDNLTDYMPTTSVIPDGFAVSLDITEITGYGDTKEEALDNAITYLKNIINTYKDIESKLDQLRSDDNITEVDCFGNEISHSTDKPKGIQVVSL